jgi:hypothetical protein
LAKKSGDKLFSGNNSTIMWNAQERTWHTSIAGA